jgi:ferrous iron transport protein B
MLGMYLLGTVAALAVAAIFKRTLLKGPVRPMILELPPLPLAEPALAGREVAQRCQLFLRRAGTVILALSIVLWAMATYPRTAVDASLPEAKRSRSNSSPTRCWASWDTRSNRWCVRWATTGRSA